MTRHLSPEALLDVAEGVPSPEMAAHLRTCDSCRIEALRLSETVTVLTDVAVPEPSPLFWDHFSERVRRAIATESQPAAADWRVRWLSWPAVTLVAAAVLLMAATIARRPSLAPSPAVASIESVDTSAGPAAGDDESLRLLADLADGLDWEAASEAGLAVGQGAADRALTELTASERLELQRMLMAALAGTGDVS